MLGDSQRSLHHTVVVKGLNTFKQAPHRPGTERLAANEQPADRSMLGVGVLLAAFMLLALCYDSDSHVPVYLRRKTKFLLFFSYEG